MKSKTNWNIKVAKFAANTVNPIRDVVENLKIEPNAAKKFIPLSIGDPTVYGNLKPCDEIIEAIVESVKSNEHNGYVASTGSEATRKAIAEYCSVVGAPLEATDIFVTSGCSHAIDMCIAALADPGENILIPRPGFPLYKTLSAAYGVQVKEYNLKPNDNWQIDLSHLESQIDSKTVAIVYNNPSNPCGSVFPEQHIRDLLAVAERHCLPVIADEIYENMVFSGHQFIPIASLTTEVPVLVCRGTTKRFLIPGYRLGWIQVHDRHSRFGVSFRKGLTQLCQRIMGANSIVQGAIPAILRNTPKTFFDSALRVIQENAAFVYNTFSRVPGLSPVKPTGAMYIMVGIDIQCFPTFKSDWQFIERLVGEESVFCLPGQAFNYPNYFRIVLTLPLELTKEACVRIAEFSKRYYVCNNIVKNNAL
ncbi:Tyrosine aminotransferase-like protein [Leptotrombidium deliense]|uniref:Tyrosine aminotransferase n=1 Tax=Leptotrombidium deliense TaxID=299467 RepID=A0A443SEP9_9ACAR|nr:Tyrosine aminotransferase-like protein [Leptotrombidium deliense]